MAKNLRWKVLLILGVIALSVFLFYPPDQKVRRGTLAIRGGAAAGCGADDGTRVGGETGVVVVLARGEGTDWSTS